MPISSLTGRRCLITGASRGIGLSIAQALASHGAHCTLVGRNSDTLSEAVSSLTGTGHDHMAGSVATYAFWDDLARKLRKKGEKGEIHTLVNAAGVTHYSLLASTSVEMVEEVMGTNLMGTVWACKSLMRGMVGRRQGCIINVGSLLGVKGGKGNVAYAASKAGIIGTEVLAAANLQGLTRSLAAEVGSSNIRVNAILPGYIDTQMTESMTPEAKTQALASIPLNRFGTPGEISDAALFLAKNEYANNCIINVDGGLSAT